MLLRYLPMAACAAALPETAQAHAMFGSAAPFWTGVLHVLVAPLALAATAALMLALAEASESAILCAVAGAAMAAFGGAELIAPAAAAAASALAACCVAAIAISVLLWRRPEARLASALGVAAGIAAGCAVGADVPDWGGSLGVCIAVLVSTSWGAAGLSHVQARAGTRLLMMRRIAAATLACVALGGSYWTLR